MIIKTMFKSILLLLTISVILISCYKPQNLDISVTGQVLDQNNRGVANVTIYIDRGVRESMWPASYNKYDSVLTNLDGKYSYLITEYKGYYKVCCKIPSQYSTLDQFCKEVDQTIIDGKTIPNIINFRLKP